MHHARTPSLAVASLLVACLATACAATDSDAPDMDSDAPDAQIESTNADAAEAGAETTGPVALVDANAASADELGGALALSAGAVEAILAGRPYARPSEFHSALSAAVGDEEARRAYETVWVPLDLNDASRDEIMLIPGMSDRMAYEFEEYRPWVDMDQFRREIGKYVDGDEVGRLERYVTIK